MNKLLMVLAAFLVCTGCITIGPDTDKDGPAFLLSVEQYEQLETYRKINREIDVDDFVDYEEIRFKVDGVMKAIEKLPEGYRIVFSLYLLEGYDHKEISEILGIQESTSKSQYLRAKQKIKEILMCDE